MILAKRSAKSFEIAGSEREFECHPAQLLRPGAVVGGRDHVFGGTAQLKQPVLERGELGAGQHDGVLGQAASLDRGPAFVGSLTA